MLHMEEKLNKIIDYAIQTDYAEYDDEYKKKQALEDAETVCVFGTGGFFEGYHHHLKRIDFVCNNDCNTWGKKIEGIPCISPEQLYNIRGVIVIIMIGDYIPIKKQLDGYGVKNFAFYELFLSVYTEMHFVLYLNTL